MEKTLSPQPTSDAPIRLEENTPDDRLATHFVERVKGGVTWRSILIGAILSVVFAALNTWIVTVHNVHFFGGIQMPFSAIFALLFLILFVNLPLRALHRAVPGTARFLPAFSPIELVTLYAMLLFATMISNPGCDNFFITAGTTLFYYTTRENGWRNLFYEHVPTWFAPGWNGKTYNPDVINPVYLGGKEFSEIPWGDWFVMLTAWSIFLLLVYAMLFFAALMFRKQWLEREALAFPLVQLPLQMVDIDGPGQKPPARAFWGNRMMWLGFGMAACAHFLTGMNAHYPDWPIFPVNAFGGVAIEFTERPWNAMGNFKAELFLGGLGIAYLLTREVSLSFWFFFLFVKFEKVFAEMLGFPMAGMTKDTYMNQPIFITFQSVGGWIAMAGILVWTAREYLIYQFREAFLGKNETAEGEPYSPRFVVLGFLLSFIALIGWSIFAGISPIFALAFFGIYLMISIVLTRIVIEGGFLFPQVTFSPLEWMTTGLFSTATIGASNLTKLSFLQPPLMSDMRTNVLPGFLHTMKLAEEMRLDRSGLRRMLGAVSLSVVLTLVTTIVVSLYALYSVGGLAGYTWFTYSGPQAVFKGTATMIQTQPGFELMRAIWMAVGGAGVIALTIARSRFTWFPLHPLGYIIGSGYPVSRLWFSFFLGWAIKSLIMKYGGSDTYSNVRPFMIGLILGNIAAMILWMIIGFYSGNQIKFWSA